MAAFSHPEVDSFFENSKVPENYEQTKLKVDEFIKNHKNDGRRIVLVTSGGTTVPLESRTIRFIDNFSVGTRGATSAECFLEQDYAVIFLHRRGSLKPYQRSFQHTNFLDMISTDTGQITVTEDNQALVSRILEQYTRVRDSHRLSLVEFTSLGEYLYLLRGLAQSLSVLGRQAMMYLAAAVSDFYIPHGELPEHKIQSSDGPLQICLQLVPKMLRPLVNKWAPHAFIVSFKLETDPKMLVPKARKALNTYNHQLVIGNLLERRKVEVVLVTQDTENWVRLSDQEQHSGTEIELKIISLLRDLHHHFTSQSAT